jgi:hypothetical protein
MTRRDLARGFLPPSLLVVTASVLLRDGDWHTRLAAGLEAAIYLAVFFLILSRHAVRNHLDALPRSHRVVLASLFTAVLAGHFAHDPRATFPFSEWSMYGRPESPDTLVFYHSEGIDTGQTRITIDEAALFPAIGASSVASKTRALATEALAQHRPGDAPQRLRDWLYAIGDTYNRSHPERPVRAVELVRYSLSLRDQGRSGPSTRPVWRVELGGRPE